MRIPTLHEIKITERHPHAIFELLKNLPIGSTPCYWVSEIPFDEELLQFLDLLEIAFRQSNIDSCLPYPFYIITTVIDDHAFFPILPNVKSIPSHFAHRGKRLKAKEQLLAQKVDILVDRLKAMNLTERREALKVFSKKSRALSRLAHEHAMMHTLLTDLMANAHKEKR